MASPGPRGAVNFNHDSHSLNQSAIRMASTSTASNGSNKTNITDPNLDDGKSRRDGVLDLVGQMNNTLNLLGPTLVTLNEQTAKISKLGPATDDLKSQVNTLGAKLHPHHKKQHAEFEELREKAKEGGQNILNELQAKIQEQVRSQITAQAKQQVEDQIKEFLPVPLQQQSEEYKQQIKEVKDSLKNSKARRSNARILATDIDEPLHVVSKANGTKSNWYPANLRSLYDYDATTCKDLIRDYDIASEEDQIREVNLNRFMAHIGLQFRIAVP